MRNIIIAAILVILVVAGGYYLGNLYPIPKAVDSTSCQATPAKDTVTSLLEELNAEFAKPNATIDGVNSFLTDKYGPCWGIPEGQCRE